MAKTKKPCPGCNQVHPNRAADQVCFTCRRKLDRVAEIETEAQRLRDTVANTLHVQTEPRMVHVPDHCYMSIGENALYDSADYRRFALSTAAVITALTEPLDRDREPPYSPTRNAIPAACEWAIRRNDPAHFGYVEVSDKAVTTVREWWKDVGAFARACYAAGLEDGRDLLGQLASGSMTLAQVNDRAMDLTRKRS